MVDPTASGTVIVVASEGMGRADVELQKKLMATYLRLLLENGTTPGAVCFYTEGVKLAVEGSPVLDSLRELEARGTHLILCKTCLEFFGLAERVRVGVIGGMTDILAAQMKASKVITL